ncbi:MAG: putative Ig domain-containing protein, partial [Chthoniobacterales bacterium]
RPSPQGLAATALYLTAELKQWFSTGDVPSLGWLSQMNGCSRYYLVWRSRATWVRLCSVVLTALVVASCQRGSIAPPADRFEILTPPAPAYPRIHGAKVVGLRPGSPFFFQIAATGKRPMRYQTVDLPAGLNLDPINGRITGALTKRGNYPVILRATNRLGSGERILSIVVGDQIALTPPMGWNSWNCWGIDVSQERVLASARGLVASGLRDHGWSYINIDDGWQGARGGPLNAIQPNSRFPDMGRLAAELHGMGLKFGIYSTPWRATLSRHNGSSADNVNGTDDWVATHDYNEFFQYQVPEFHSWLDGYGWLKPLAGWLRKRRRRAYTEQMRRPGKYSFVSQDVKQWEEWGVDYLKYDWAPIDLGHVVPMHDELVKAPRDIFYSLSNNAPFSLAPELSKLANAWRTSVDLKDNWRSISQVGFSRDKWAAFNGPNHYNDADMLVLGKLHWNRPGMTRLTANEQYTHFSLWCLLSGPLLLGCALEDLDPFTIGLVTNDEVIDVDQDPLCKQATRITSSGQGEVYAKPMEDGSWAVGLFNRGSSAARVSVALSDLHMSGRVKVRDLWRQKNLGVFALRFEAPVARHGVVLLRMSSAL